jgi:hypothetical protein
VSIGRSSSLEPDRRIRRAHRRTGLDLAPARRPEAGRRELSAMGRHDAPVSYGSSRRRADRCGPTSTARFQHRRRARASALRDLVSRSATDRTLR